MRASVRFGIAATAASLALAPAPLAAQEAAAPAAPPADSVGPAQLKDFSLDGTVIRRAEPAEQRSEPAPARQRPSTASAAPVSPAAPREAAPAPARDEPVRQSAERQAESRPTASASGQPSLAGAPDSVARAAALDLPPPSPADPLFSPAPVLPAADSSEPAPYASAQTLPYEDGFSPLPWLIALLLAGGAAAYYFRRQRSGLAFAGAGSEPGTAELAPPRPAPQRVPPRPAPPPAPAPPAAPVGIVATRLRPWLDLQLRPQRLVLEADRATIEFDVVVSNSGSGPARDVLIEALMFNAGPIQDQEVGAFFDRPVGRGDRVPLIEPLKSMGFRSAVSLPRDQLRQFKAGEHTVFVPLVAFNALYRGGGVSECQTSVCCLVGKQTGGDKLAPFRLDQAPRAFTGLAARELELRVRK